MKNLVKLVVAIMVMIVATSGMGFAQGMVYQTHQTMALEAATGLMETWVHLPSDYVRVTTTGSAVTIESTAGWTEVIAHTYHPCIAEYNGTIWAAMSQIGGNAVTINGTTHPAPPAGVSYTLLVKLNSSGSVLGSWQAIGEMELLNIAVKDNSEIAVVGTQGIVLEHITAPNGGGTVLIHDGIDWDTTKGFAIETPSGGSKPWVTSAQYLPNGNLALAGYTDGGTVSFGGIMLPPHGGQDGFRGEITPQGVGITTVQMAGNGTDLHHLQTTKADGSFMVSGVYTDLFTLYNADGSVGGTLGQFPAGATHDHVYFALYNASGVFQHAEMCYSTTATTDLLNIDLVVDDGDFYAMIGNTNGGTAITPTGSHDKVAPIILKFDETTGVALWSKQMDGVGSNVPTQYGEEVLVDGDIVTLCSTEYLDCDLDFDTPVVAVNATSFWAEYNDGDVPTITAQPVDVTGCEGSSMFVEVTAENADSYQWYHDNVVVSGATDSILWFDPAILADDGDYYCEVTNTVGSVNSDTVTVTVNPLVVVTGSPSDVTVLVGGSFTLTSAGSNVDDNQWYHDGVVISGATGPSYTVSSAVLADSGEYYNMMSNGCGSVNTDTAFVTVNEPFATYTPDTTSVTSVSGNVTSQFETNDASASNVLTGDPDASVSPVSMSTGVTTVTLSYPANTDMAMKQYVVTATTSPNGEVATWIVNQDGATPSIELTPSEVTVNSNITSTSTVLSTQSDMTWTVDDTGLPADWSVAPMSGTGDETLIVTMTVNTGTDPVIGSFTVNGTGAGAAASATFQITQLGVGVTLEADASSDKSVYTEGQTIQLYGSATGGEPPYSYDWTGPGFSSSEQNPTLPAVAGENQVYTLIVTDNNGDTDTDTVEIDVFVVSFYIEVNPLSGTTDDEYSFYSEIVQDANDPRTVTYHSIEFGDGESYSGSGNILETTHQYAEAGTYDIEQSYELSDGSTDSYTNVGLVGVITDVTETSINNIKIYPNPTNGTLFINAQERPEMVSVINMSGSEVIHLENLGKMTQIDLSSLSSGLYFVNIHVNGVRTTNKVVKR